MASSIRIKPSERGSLHRAMGVPQGKKISRKSLATEKAKAKRTGNVRLERKVVFAQNFGKKKR